MDVKAIMIDIETRLKTVTGLTRTFGWPQATVSGQSAIVSYPDSIEYDQTYGRGLDKLVDFPVIVLIPRPTDRTARDRVAGFTSPVGAASVKLALEATPSANWDDLQVKRCDLDAVKVGGTDYLAATFYCDIHGSGKV